MTTKIRFPWWWLVYRALGVVAEPFARTFLGRRAAGRFGAGRLGLAADLPRGRLWIHAVSVGEVRAVAPMVREWLSHGGGPILLTVGTSAGLETAERLFADGAVAVAVAPLDLPGPVSRFLDAARPRAALFVETELWPVILGECARRGIPTGWVNGRISDRTMAARGVWRQALGWMVRRLDPRLMRGLEDLDRARELAGDGKGACLGDLKYDRVSSAAPPDGGAWGLGTGMVLVAGSVHDGEDAILLSAYRELRSTRPALRLVLAPRRLSLVPAILEERARQRLEGLGHRSLVGGPPAGLGRPGGGCHWGAGRAVLLGTHRPGRGHLGPAGRAESSGAGGPRRAGAFRALDGQLPRGGPGSGGGGRGQVDPAGRGGGCDRPLAGSARGGRAGGLLGPVGGGGALRGGGPGGRGVARPARTGLASGPEEHFAGGGKSDEGHLRGGEVLGPSLFPVHEANHAHHLMPGRAQGGHGLQGGAPGGAGV
ncbi:hypothetical protein IIA16_06625, partial [bacterium]|nr:hypothetical protein [bacterium]